MRKLFKNRNLQLLCSAIVLSTTGSWLLIYALSTSLYLQTGSLVSSSMVFFSKIIPSAVAGIIGGNLADRIHPRNLLRILNVVCFFFTLFYLIPVQTHSYWLLYLLIAIRSLFDHTETMGREVSVVCFFENSLQLKANTLINTANLVSMAFASALGIFLLKILSLQSLILFDAVTFLASAIILTFLKKPEKQNQFTQKHSSQRLSFSVLLNDMKEAWKEICRNAVIKDAIAYGAVLGIFLEGSRFILHHYTGLVRFQTGASGVSFIVAIEAVGMIAGGFFTGLVANWLMKGKWKLIVLAILVAFFYLLQIMAGSTEKYLIFVFWTSVVYQVFDIHTINMMIDSCPPHLLGKVSGLWIKLFALPTISLMAILSSIIIPVLSSSVRATFFIVLPLAIILGWEIYKYIVKHPRQNMGNLKLDTLKMDI